MATQQEKPATPSDRPSFFGMPSGGRFWLEVGPRFWGGALMGLGFGTFFGIAVPQQGWWGILIFVVLWFIGLNITLRDLNAANAVKNANN
jgi:hypothetical protein